MRSTLIFDLAVVFTFAAATAIGSAFGFKKVIVLLLVLAVPSLLKTAFWLAIGSRSLIELMRGPNATLYQWVDLGLLVLSLVVFIWMLLRFPRARSWVGKTGGAVLGAGCAVFTVIYGSLLFSLFVTNPAIYRTDTLTGPTLFAVNDWIMAQLPDNPDNFFKRDDHSSTPR